MWSLEYYLNSAIDNLGGFSFSNFAASAGLIYMLKFTFI